MSRRTNPATRKLATRSLAALAVLASLANPVSGQQPGEPPPLVGAAHDVGLETFEPTLGTTANGDVYFSITPTRGVAIGWSASIARSADKGRTWKDVGPRLGNGTMPPETNDPYIYVDPATGRVFTFHMSPILTCSISSFSDDAGATWTTNPLGCSPTVVWDHQTVVAAKPRMLKTVAYPNVLHQCVNAIYAAMCSRSIDGGLSWQPSVPAYENRNATSLCGAQHGHLAAGPDGTVYLPTSLCGTRPMVYVSRDDGLTWQASTISTMNIPFVDPTVSVDSQGNVYAAFIDESGWLYYSVSRDAAATWSVPVQAAPGFTGQMPVIVAGDPGRIVIAYPATDDLRDGFATAGYPGVSGVAWGANLTVSYDALASEPTFETVVATGEDPIGRGAICNRGTRCSFLVDFIEAVIGPDGMPYAAFVDGCTSNCAKKSGTTNNLTMGRALMATLVSGTPLCESTCWRYAAPPAAASSATLGDRLDAASASSAAAAGRAHTVDALSAQLRRARLDATAARVEAVLGSRR